MRKIVFLYFQLVEVIGKRMSANLVHALVYAKEQNTKIVGVVGRDGLHRTGGQCLLLDSSGQSGQHHSPHRSLPCFSLARVGVPPKIKNTKTKWESV